MTESQIQKQVCDALTQLGVERFRIQCGKTKARGGWQQGNKAGTADLLAAVRFQFSQVPSWLWIEVKKPGGKQSKEQREFEAERAAKNQIYLLIESVDQLLEWFKNSGAKG